MIGVAWAELAHGTPMSEVHLITPVPLTVSVSTSIIASGGAYHFGNAIHDAVYVEPADSRPLPHDGITHPSSWIPRA
jgi:hypothetical protein